MATPDPEFTDAAEAALEEYQGSQRRRIMSAAAQEASAAQRDTVDVGMLLRAIQMIQRADNASRPRSGRDERVRRFAATYTLVGLLIAALGMALFIVQASEFNELTAASLAAVIGLVTAAIGWVLPQVAGVPAGLQRRRGQVPEQAGDAVIEFLGQWNLFEREVRSVRVTPGVDVETRTLSQKLSQLEAAGILSESEESEARSLLARRNELAHGRPGVDSPSSVRNDTASLSRLTRTLEARATAWESRGRGNLPSASGSEE